MKIATVTIFCGSKPGNNPAFVSDANNLGSLLAKNGVTIVYGGGNKGIMGTIANASLSVGGKWLELFQKY